MRPVYNLSLAGSTPYVDFRYLQHALNAERISLLVWGLEFESFLDLSQDHVWPPIFESRLGVTNEGAVNYDWSLQRLRDMLYAGLSFDALTDSVGTLVANLSNRSSDIVSGNWEVPTPSPATMENSPAARAILLDIYISRRLAGRHMDPRAMNNVRKVLDLCASNGVKVMLIISPSHADQLELLRLEGLSSEFEAWERDLVALANSYVGNPSAEAGVTLWDFNGYNKFTTETLSSKAPDLNWFVDSVHYNRMLGSLIIERIAKKDIEDFGVLLTQENIDSHVQALREEGRIYRERHPEDFHRVKSIFTSVLRRAWP
jgi:hypothetical protein